MFFFLYLTSSVSLVKRLPLQTSQVMYTVGKKCISTAMTPLPSQVSHRPPPRSCLTLKEKRFGFHSRARASRVSAKRSRIKVNEPAYVAGLERGVRPIGDWSMSMARLKCSLPSNLAALSVLLERYFLSKRARKFSCKISYRKDDLPEPDTPVTATIRPSGTSTSRFFILNTEPPFILREPLSFSRRASGTSIAFSPRRYESVTEPLSFFLAERSLSTQPSATICPPCTPAPGPMSTK